MEVPILPDACQFCLRGTERDGQSGTIIIFACNHVAHIKCAMPAGTQSISDCKTCSSADYTAKAAVATDPHGRDRLVANASTTSSSFRAAEQCSRAIGTSPHVVELLTSAPVSVAHLHLLDDQARRAVGAGTRLDAFKRGALLKLAEIEHRTIRNTSNEHPRRYPTALSRKVRDMVKRHGPIKDPASHFPPVSYQQTTESVFQTGIVRSENLAAKTASASARLEEQYVLLSLALLEGASPEKIVIDDLLTFRAIAEVTKRDARVIFDPPIDESQGNVGTVQQMQARRQVALDRALSSGEWTITTVVKAKLLTNGDDLLCLRNIAPYLRTHGAALFSIGITYAQICDQLTGMKNWRQFASLRFTAEDLLAIDLCPDEVVNSVVSTNSFAEFAAFRYLGAKGLDDWGLHMDHLRKLVTRPSMRHMHLSEDRVQSAMFDYATNVHGLAIPDEDARTYFFT